MYDPLCPNNCFTNWLRGYFFCSLITISYIELHTPSMAHGVFGVEEVDVPLVLSYIVPVLSQIKLHTLYYYALSHNNLRMIHHDPTIAL